MGCEVLNQLGPDEKDARIISNLYWKQTTIVRVDDTATDEIAIRRGVRQRCVPLHLIIQVLKDVTPDRGEYR